MRTPDGSQHRHQAYLRQTFLIELSTDLGKSVANSWRKLGNLGLDITITYPLRYRRFRTSTTATLHTSTVPREFCPRGPRDGTAAEVWGVAVVEARKRR